MGKAHPPHFKQALPPFVHPTPTLQSLNSPSSTVPAVLPVLGPSTLTFTAGVNSPSSRFALTDAGSSPLTTTPASSASRLCGATGGGAGGEAVSTLRVVSAAGSDAAGVLSVPAVRLDWAGSDGAEVGGGGVGNGAGWTLATAAATSLRACEQDGQSISSTAERLKHHRCVKLTIPASACTNGSTAFS